jgi:hypothetical protein
MTRGALIFAFNNEQTDYITMAKWSAQRIRQHLNIPVAVVTNDKHRARTRNFDRIIAVEASSGGTRWFEDYQATVSWHNASRVDAYDLTPWDETLVLDADYVVNSNNLGALFDVNQDFLCFRSAYDITNPDKEFMKGFGKYHLPMHWATVMMFRKSVSTAWIFDSMKMIKNNWQHYRDLYGISETNYRNDYALSIALALVNGGSGNVDSIPWSMASVLPEHRLKCFNDSGLDCWEVEYQNINNKPHILSVFGQDFHAMGKKSLGDIIAA